MDFRYLGNSGLKISEITYGNWLTHGSQVENDVAAQCVRAALDAGISTFDTADVYANTAAVTSAGVQVSFPHQHADCLRCGNCKGLHARRYRSQGHVVIGVGDSHTDLCLAREADHVFARAWLASHCRTSGLAHREFEDFHPVTALVASLVGADPASTERS